MDMSFNGMVSDPHCRYTEPTGASSFIQIGNMHKHSMMYNMQSLFDRFNIFTEFKHRMFSNNIIVDNIKLCDLIG